MEDPLEELTKICKIYQVFKIEDARCPPLEIRERLQEISRNNLNDHKISEALSDTWISYFRCILNLGETSDYMFNIAEYIDDFFKVIVTMNKVSYIVDDEEKARVLASVCLKRVSIYEQGFDHTRKSNVADVLSQWFNKSIPTKITTSLPAISNYLYGGACWDLYEDDVAQAFMPGHLYRLGVCLSNKTTMYDEVNATYSLPKDLTP